MLASRLSLQPVDDGDFEAMVSIRIEALRPSLERLGRFDPVRARERLAAGFVPRFMHHIVLDAQERVGFLTLKPKDDEALRLDHLYLRDAHQGMGVGAWAIAWAQRQAGGKPMHVTALKQSDANRFYARHGFVCVGEDEWDIHYRWQATGAVA